jgi:hypothetical protein
MVKEKGCSRKFKESNRRHLRFSYSQERSNKKFNDLSFWERMMSHKERLMSWKDWFKLKKIRLLLLSLNKIELLKFTDHNKEQELKQKRESSELFWRLIQMKNFREDNTWLSQKMKNRLIWEERNKNLNMSEWCRRTQSLRKWQKDQWNKKLILVQIKLLKLQAWEMENTMLSLQKNTSLLTFMLNSSVMNYSKLLQ